MTLPTKMTKRRALAILKQLKEEIIEFDLHPRLKWEVNELIEKAKEKPAKFFKIPEHSERFLSVLGAMQADGKLLDI